MKQVPCEVIRVLERRIHMLQSQSRARKRNRETKSDAKSKLSLFGGRQCEGPGAESAWARSFVVATNGQSSSRASSSDEWHNKGQKNV